MEEERIRLKGISAWILVIGGVILGMIVFFAGIYISMQNIKINQKQAALEQINTLYEKMERTCLVGGIGETYYYKISLPESIRAVYVANYSDEEPPDKVSVFISEKKIALGKFFCYQFFNEAPNCRKVSCNTFMTYIGTPSMKEDLLSLLGRITGETPRYNYTIIINKTFFDTVIVVTKPTDIPITTTTTTLIQRQTTTTTIFTTILTTTTTTIISTTLPQTTTTVEPEDRPPGPPNTTTLRATTSINEGSNVSQALYTSYQPCPKEPRYPIDKWDRVWCDREMRIKLADSPDENSLNFDNNWGSGIVGGIRNDNISFISGRTIIVTKEGRYRITVGSDDGIRVWLNNALILDKWQDRSYREDIIDIYFGKPGSYFLRIDYYENRGSARVSFRSNISQELPTIQDAFDIFIVPVEVSSSKQNIYLREANNFINHFLSVSPFRECSNRNELVRFWIINISQCPETASSSCTDLCSDCINIGRNCARKMERILGVSYDKFIVLTETSSNIGGGCAGGIPYDGASAKLSISCNNSLCVPTHELGHLLGLGHINSSQPDNSGLGHINSLSPNPSLRCYVPCHACQYQNPNCDDCFSSETEKLNCIMDYCPPMSRFLNNAYIFLRNYSFGTTPHSAGLGSWMKRCRR